MRSLRVRLALLVGLGQLSLLALLNWGLWRLAQSVFTEEFDERLEIQAGSIASLIDQEGPYVELDYKPELATRFEREIEPDYFQIWVEGVGVLHRSGSLHGGDLEPPAEQAEHPSSWDGTLPDGRPGRWVGMRFPIAGYVEVAEDGARAARCTGVLVMGTDRRPIDRELARFRTGLFLLDGLIAAGAALVVWLVVRRGLSPVLALARRVEGIQGPQDAARLGSIDLPIELQTLSSSVQSLHERLSSALERERRLSGHIAHELRTPISELRVLADVALADREDLAGQRQALEQARDISMEMEKTVTVLLSMWRTQALESQVGAASVDLVALMGELQERVQPRATERNLRWKPMDRSKGVAAADRKALELVLGNLIDNAVEHSPVGSDLVWACGSSDESVWVQISNPSEANGRAAGSGDSRHAGLGLALARRVCELAGFRLDAGRAGGAWSARLQLPRAQTGAGG
ncbi:MAG: sensor histidine kinase N-terminal domain-containing protein [Planctomycetota bacterium]